VLEKKLGFTVVQEIMMEKKIY